MLSSAASCASLRAMPRLPTHTLTCRQHGPRVRSYLCQSRAPETNNKDLGRADPGTHSELCAKVETQPCQSIAIWPAPPWPKYE